MHSKLIHFLTSSSSCQIALVELSLFAQQLLPEIINQCSLLALVLDRCGGGGWWPSDCSALFYPATKSKNCINWLSRSLPDPFRLVVKLCHDHRLNFSNIPPRDPIVSNSTTALNPNSLFTFAFITIIHTFSPKARRPTDYRRVLLFLPVHRARRSSFFNPPACHSRCARKSAITCFCSLTCACKNRENHKRVIDRRGRKNPIDRGNPMVDFLEGLVFLFLSTYV